MADSVIELLLKTVADLKGVKQVESELDAVNRAFGETQQSLKSFSGTSKSAFSGLVGALAPVAAGLFVAKKSVDLFFASINEAQEAERNLQQLTSALEATGEATKSNIESFQQYASQIESVTRFGDDLIIQQLAIAKNFGLTNDEAKKLVETATDLSAVTGQDLTKSTEDLLKTLAGQLPRELKILGVEFGNLTEAQLKAGAAIDLVGKKFGDRAEKEVKTLSGAISQLGNTFGNILENIGQVATQSTFLGNAIAFTNQKLREFGGLESDEEKLKRLREEAVKAQGALRNLAIKGEIIEIEARINGKKLSEGAQEIADQINFAKQSVRGNIADIQINLDRGSIDKILKDVKNLGLTSIQLAKQERDERLKLLSDAFGGEKNFGRLSVEDKKLFTDAKLRIEKEYNKKVADDAKKAQKETEDSARKALQTFNEARQNVAKGLEQFFKTGNKQALGGAVAGIGQAVTQGASGARSLLGSAAQLGGNALAPGVGDAIAPIIQELSKGKEAAKAFVTEFLNAIPDMINGLVEGIVAAAEAFVENVPKIIDRFIQEIPQLINSLAESMPKVAVALSQQMTTVAITFAASLVEQAPAIAQALIKAIPNAVGGGARGIGKVLGFAEGGSAFVKSVPGGFSNDTFPARLTSGELVVDRSTAFKLKEFLDGNGKTNTADQTSQDNSANESLLRALSAPIILNIDGREIARAVRRQERKGFSFAT